MGLRLAALGGALAVLGDAMGFGSAGLAPDGAGGWGAGVDSACNGRACITRMAKKNAAIRRTCRPFALLTGITSP
jgi:hypothetical protein